MGKKLRGRSLVQVEKENKEKRKREKIWSCVGGGLDVGARL